MREYTVKRYEELDRTRWINAVRNAEPYCFWLMPEPLRFLEAESQNEVLFLNFHAFPNMHWPIVQRSFQRFGLPWKGASFFYAPWGEALTADRFQNLLDDLSHDFGWDYLEHAYTPLVPETSSPHAFPLQKPWQTALIDLAREEADLWKRLERHAKKNIERLSAQHQVQVRILEDGQSMETLYVPLLRESRQRRNAGLPRFYPCQRLLDHTEGYSEYFIKAFVAMLGEEVLAGLGVLGTKEGIIEVGVAQSARDHEEKWYAHDLIKWEIIRWAKSQGIRWYDLGGFNPHPKDAKEEGIKRFKSKWGGELFCYGVWEWHPLSAKAKAYESTKKFLRLAS